MSVDTNMKIFLEGGPKHGQACRLTIHQGVIPKRIVFQGIFDGLFRVIDYVRVRYTNTYQYDEF